MRMRSLALMLSMWLVNSAGTTEAGVVYLPSDGYTTAVTPVFHGPVHYSPHYFPAFSPVIAPTYPVYGAPAVPMYGGTVIYGPRRYIYRPVGPWRARYYVYPGW